jgi:regulatory protein
VESDLPKFSKKKLTPLVAQEKMKGWCAYRERSQYEARQKLYEFGLYSTDVENIISNLIEENFLNEERYAMAFARGKFRIKKWGRIKIKIELKAQKVSDYCINKALKEIDPDEYFVTLERLIEKKFLQTKEPNAIKKYYKVLQYAISRGYEKDMIGDILKTLEK